MDMNGQLNPIFVLPAIGLAIIGASIFGPTGAAIGFGLGLVVAFAAMH